jgi:hypothetical protein
MSTKRNPPTRRPPRKRRTRCWSCGKTADRREDYCYGCKHIVCLACSYRYDHFLDHAHGRKRRSRRADC